MSDCGISYRDVIEMDDDEIYEANAALDIYNEMIKRQMDEQKKNRR